MCQNFETCYSTLSSLAQYEWKCQNFLIFINSTFLSLLSPWHLIHSLILSSSPSILPTFDSLSQPLILSINPSNRTLTIKNQNHASVQSSFAIVLPAHPPKLDLADLSSKLAVDYSFGLTNATADLANPRRQSCQSSPLISPVLVANHAADLHNCHWSLVEFGSAFYSLYFWLVDFFFFLLCWGFWIWNLLEDSMIVGVVCGDWCAVGGGCSGGCWLVGGNCHWVGCLYIGWDLR